MTRRTWLLVLLPAGLFFLAFYVVPQLAFLRVSFQEFTGPAQSDGFTTSNYTNVVTDPFLRRAVLETLRLGAIVTVLTTLIAYPLAIAVVRSRPWMGRLIFVVVVSSTFMSAVVRALGWRVILGQTGMLNTFLLRIGIIDEPLQLFGTFTGVVIGMVHLLIPFVVLAIIPVVETVKPTLLQAAYGLGASRWYTFWRVVFPMTVRGVLPGALLAFALTAGSFTTPALLGGGRVGILPIFIRQDTLVLLNYPRGAVFAVILLVLVLAIVLLSNRAAHRTRTREAEAPEKVEPTAVGAAT